MDQKLTIYYTSDVHGYLMPVSYEWNKPENTGLLNCSSQFQKDGNTLIIDGGDMLQGSPMVQYCQKFMPHYYPQVEVMNKVGYDVITLGNHDFNFGMPYLKEYLNQLNAKCTCVNVKDRKSGIVNYPWILKILENGMKIGIIGIVTAHVNVWEHEANIRDILIENPLKTAKEILSELKDMVDLTIGIYHGGFEEDIQTHRLLTESKENIGAKICRELDFDVLLTGHQHMPIEGQYLYGTYVVQTPPKAQQFIHMEIKKGIKHFECSSKLVDAGAKSKEDLRNMILPLEQIVQKWLDQPVGYFEKELLPDNKLEMALHGSPIADFLNKVQLECSGADISCTSLANDVAGFSKEVTIRNVLANYPFTNTLIVLQITGSQLKEALERTAQYFERNEHGQLEISETFLLPKVEHYNYDYFSGITYEIDIRCQKGQRVKQVKFKEQEIDDKDLLTLCLNNYRASGAGGYDVYKKCKLKKEILREMPELITEYIENQKLVKIERINNYRVLF